MKYWTRVGVICLILLGGGMWYHRSGAEQIQMPSQTDCTYYVDNQAGTDGDGSLNTPWNNVAGHVNDLEQGDVMCVRGDLSAPGRIYTESTISLDENSDTRNGTEEYPITIRTYPDEHVVLHTTGSTILEFVNVEYWHVDGFALDGEGNLYHLVHFSWANSNVVRNCEIYNGTGAGVDFTYGEYNVIENCTIHSFDAGSYRDAHGIIVAGGKGNVVRDNEIYDCTGDGIQIFNYNDVSDTVIENNHIYTTLGKCSENAIDVKIGSAVIRGNIIHGFRYCDGSCGGSGGGIGEAIIMHIDATDILIEGNEIYDSVSGIVVGAPNVQIVNNVIHDLVVDLGAWANVGIYVHHSGNVDIINNTLANIPHNSLWIGEVVRDMDVQNNLFYNSGQVQNELSPSEVASDYNGWFGAAERIDGPHDIAGSDPMFVSTDDYHLRATSLAVDVGDSAYAPAYDLDGNPRPYGPGVDLGAFEVQEPLPVTNLRAGEAVTTTDSVTITLTWTAPGRIGETSTAHHYELRHDYWPITEGRWDQAVVLDANVPAGQPGEAQSITVNVPWGGTAQTAQWHAYFALRVFDVDGRVSEVSNAAFWPAEFVFLPIVGRTWLNSGTLIYGGLE